MTHKAHQLLSKLLCKIKFKKMRHSLLRNDRDEMFLYLEFHDKPNLYDTLPVCLLGKEKTPLSTQLIDKENKSPISGHTVANYSERDARRTKEQESAGVVDWSVAFQREQRIHH